VVEMVHVVSDMAAGTSADPQHPEVAVYCSAVIPDVLASIPYVLEVSLDVSAHPGVLAVRSDVASSERSDLAAESDDPVVPAFEVCVAEVLPVGGSFDDLFEDLVACDVSADQQLAEQHSQLAEIAPGAELDVIDECSVAQRCLLMERYSSVY